MGWFPVVADSIDEVEAQLGVALPQMYKSILLEPRVADVLSDALLGTFDRNFSMHQFAGMTQILREAHPEFPRDGVVAFCASLDNDDFTLEWGNWRFWLPDKVNPGRLEDVFYNWNLKTRKKSFDCSTADMLVSYIGIVQGDDSTLLQELGYAVPLPLPAPPLTTSLPCDRAVLAYLGLRGAELAAVLPSIANVWLPCARLTLKGKFLCPRDLGQEPTSSARESIKVAPGVYEVSVQLCKSRMRNSDWPVVQAVRVLMQGAVSDDSVPAFKVDVDQAAICIFDRQAFFKQVLVDERDEALELISDVQEKPCVIVAGKGAQAIVMPSGDGDGTYQVNQLLAAGASVGLEVVFMSPAA